MANIPANRVGETPVFLRVNDSPTNPLFYSVILKSRTFTGTLKDLTATDKMVVIDTQTGEEISLVKHKKVPQLVLESGPNKRVSFLEIDDETIAQKKLSDDIVAAKKASAAALEAQRQVQAQAASKRREMTPGSTSGMSKIEKIIHKAKSHAKRFETLTADQKKTKEKLDNYTEELVAAGYTVSIVDGELTVTKNDSAPETEGSEGVDLENQTDELEPTTGAEEAEADLESEDEINA